MTIESLKTEHYSKPSNPLIADACFKAGYIESWGRGTMKIYKSCREAGLPEPLIIEKDGGIEVTLFKQKTVKGIKDDFGTNSERFRKEYGINIFDTFNAIVENRYFGTILDSIRHNLQKKYNLSP